MTSLFSDLACLKEVKAIFACFEKLASEHLPDNCKAWLCNEVSTAHRQCLATAEDATFQSIEERFEQFLMCPSLLPTATMCGA